MHLEKSRKKEVGMLPDQGHADASYTDVMPCDTTVQQVTLQQTGASDVTYTYAVDSFFIFLVSSERRVKP